jgi:RNA polymerase sigma factor (sigma-70 family)
MDGRQARRDRADETDPQEPQMIAAPHKTLTDEQLVAHFRCGDDDAFAEIYRRYRATLIAFATKMLHASGHDPDDVVQDAFMRAFRGLRATACPIALRAWLYMVVRNRALDDLRSCRGTLEYDEAQTARPDWYADPAQRLSDRDELRRLVEEIGRLPRRQRMALVLRELDGCTHAQTARALQTTVPGTKSLLVRARSNLGTALRAA